VCERLVSDSYFLKVRELPLEDNLESLGSERKRKLSLLLFEALKEWTVVDMPPETMLSRNGLKNDMQDMKIAKLSCMLVVR
jgi:hypothetical protein